MSIQKLTIQNYGHFQDRTFEFSPGLNILYGPNEAGKSTLLHCLRFILFDRVRGRHAHQESLSGKNKSIGGRLVFGDVQIHRIGKTLQLSRGGKPIAESELREILGGFDRATFNAVFACELKDLTALEALDKEELKQNLFASSVMGSTKGIKKMATSWDKRLKVLGQTGRSGQLKVINASIRGAERSLTEAREQALSVPSLVEEKSELSRRLCLLDSQRKQVAVQLEDLRKVSKARELFEQWQQTDLELSRKEKPPRSAAELSSQRERLQSASAQVEERKRDVDSRKIEVKLAAEALEETPLDEALLAGGEEVERLLGQVQQVTKPQDLSTQKTRLQNKVQQNLKELGLPDIEALHQVKGDQASISELRELAAAVGQNNSAGLTEALEDLSVAEQAVVELESRRQAAKEPGPALALQHRLPEVRRLKEQLHTSTQRLDEVRRKVSQVSKSLVEITRPWGELLNPTEIEVITAKGAWNRWYQKEQRDEVVRRELNRRRREAEAEEARLSTPRKVVGCSAEELQWAQRHPTVLQSQSQMIRKQQRARSLSAQLTKELSAYPEIGGLSGLQSASSVSWTAVSALLAQLDKAMEQVTQQVEGVVVPLPSTSERAKDREAVYELWRRSSARDTLWFLPYLLVMVTIFMLFAVVVAAVTGRIATAVVFFGLLLVTLVCLSLYFLWSTRLRSALRAYDPSLSRASTLELGELALSFHDKQPNQSLSPEQHAEAINEVRDLQERLDQQLQVAPALQGAGASRLREICTKADRWTRLLHELSDAQHQVTDDQALINQWIERGASLAKTKKTLTLSQAEEQAQVYVEANQVHLKAKGEDAERRASLVSIRKRLQNTGEELKTLNEAPTPLKTAAEVALSVLGAVPKGREEQWLQAHGRARSARTSLNELTEQRTHLTVELSATESALTKLLTSAKVEKAGELQEAVSTAVAAHEEVLGLEEELAEARRERDRLKKKATDGERRERRRQLALASYKELADSLNWPEASPAALESQLKTLKRLHEDNEEHLAVLAQSQAAAAEERELVLAVNKLADTLGVPRPEPDQCLSWLKQQRKAGQEALENSAQHQERGLHLQTATNTLERAQRELVAATERFSAVAQEAGVAQVHELIELERRATEWESLRGQLAQRAAKVEAALGREMSQCLELMSQVDGSFDDEGEVAKKLQAVEQSKSEAERQLGALTEKVERLSEDIAVAAAAQELLELKEAQKRVFLEVAELQLAKELLRISYDRFVRENQPEVLTLASKLLNQSSQGHMVAVREQEGKLHIEGRDGQLRTPDQLSKGAMEMLYLVCRFALAMEQCKRAKLPIVLDDVLVNQDPARAKGLVSVIKEVAKQQQVLFLTCRPEAVALLKDALPDANEVTLPRYGAAA